MYQCNKHELNLISVILSSISFGPENTLQILTLQYFLARIVILILKAYGYPIVM